MSGAWSTCALKYLFLTVTMTPTAEGITRWQNVVESEHLRRIPRRAIINSCPVPDYEPWNTNYGPVPEYDLVEALNPEMLEDSGEEFTDEEARYEHFYNSFQELVAVLNLTEASYISHSAVMARVSTMIMDSRRSSTDKTYYTVSSKDSSNGKTIIISLQSAH